MRYLAVALLLVAGNAMAEAPLCWGKPIEQVTHDLAQDSFIVGTEPIKVDRQTCGGGLDKNGGEIPKWECFIQLWDLDDPNMVLKLAYSRPDKKWLLSNAQLCNVRNGQCRMFPGVERCKNVKVPAKNEPTTESPYKL
jgi:hypothetical protein